jgi:hypothetical protein
MGLRTEGSTAHRGKRLVGTSAPGCRRKEFGVARVARFDLRGAQARREERPRPLRIRGPFGCLVSVG